MDNVILLPEMLKDFTYESGGTYEYVDSEPVLTPGTVTTFKAVPITHKDSTMYQLIESGKISINSLKIYSYTDLSDVVGKEVTRVSNGRVYKLLSFKEYEEIANIFIYVLDEVVQ